MGLTHADAKSLSLWEYGAMLSEWNKRRRAEADQPEEVEAPTSDRLQRNFAKIPAAAFGGPH